MTVDEIYLEIAHNIIDAIETQWTVAIITCELAEDAGRFKGIYKEDIESAVDHDFGVSYETYKAFKNLHEITTEGGENKWNRAKFTLYPTGKFSIDFEWDQGLANEIQANSM
ncbi:antitoxin YezG family protein [Rheinheimera sp. UJ51]|uniref:immunity protein YezG family protein n=1 Tax=Rheinheimera sp. UJ51 TaxID=2892446 RepID=UPI001E2E56D1|nr:immunity protein YezG family protein [Rheinheimera sp. UJ51]MCC5453124.1 antitoxin YezG family protein [Rheinheimera sp. UJ51]